MLSSLIMTTRHLTLACECFLLYVSSLLFSPALRLLRHIFASFFTLSSCA